MRRRTRGTGRRRPTGLAVVDARGRVHDVVEYLAHTEVARSIGDRLTV
ncbi:hypothetical protein [Streptomyces sp. NRRL S-37]|nr:hypothetical protein [Streptomyces sp. NRRL S-37]